MERGSVFVPAVDVQELTWTDLDRKAVDTVRVLAADAVQKVGNGHPGTAMSLAPAAYLLFQKLMRHDPSDPAWIGRDRFILSPGHSSLTLYIQLFLAGYGLEVEDLQALRTWGSLTPGHPEYKHTAGVEITTGPLGQGLASSVGFAYSQRRERGLYDPQAPAGESPFDHTVWVIASDGDLQEGVTAEASSLAGHQELGNLVVIYDENHISIEDDTDVAFTEDVLKRYEAYGWHTQRVDWTATGEYKEDIHALYDALVAAKAETGRPSIISLRTIIGWPAPTKQNTGKIHGSALGAEEVAALKGVLGFDAEKTFEVDPEVLAHTRGALERGSKARAAWQESFDAWKDANSEAAALQARIEARQLPTGWESSLPVFPAGKDISTRAASGKVLNAIGPVPSRTTPRSRARRRSSPPRARPRPGRATPTAACCTSASASTPPRRSSTASPWAGRPGRSPAHSSSSPTTSAPRSASPRSWASRPRTSGRTTRSASARTARPTSRSSSSPPSARSRASTSSAPPTRTRPRGRGRPSSRTPRTRPASS
jgi:transketolase